MRRILYTAVTLIILAVILPLTGCGKYRGHDPFIAQPSQYQWHKNTLYMSAHWNYTRSGKDTIVADGYIEPFDKTTALTGISLELVGMDEGGKVVNSAPGKPLDNTIAMPYDKSPFKITMKLNGREQDFTIRGSYNHYKNGSHPDFSADSFDRMLLKSDDD